uniref:Fe2OG dioxygenase domain-containing protein n=2 Tax=Hemiselmis andersenii TaxID=464988 RepID=A0A7S1HJJ2_HEMAN
MDEEMTDAVFWGVVKAVNRAEQEEKPLSTDVPNMLHRVFEADMRHLLGRQKLTTNLTCMQPALKGADCKASLTYVFDDAAHKDLPLMEGRRCEDGDCCDVCSRNIFPTFASEAEISLKTFPELAALTFNDLENVASATILQFVRLVERVRRMIAHEYGLPLWSILPLQAYSRKYVAGTTQKGGGGGEGSHVILHTDEATHSGYHYSSVMYLSTQGKDFEGGNFVFNDPAPKKGDPGYSEEKEDVSHLTLEEQMRRNGRKLTPFHPTRGSAVIFSSGWENMHEVEKITKGTRYAVPSFFTTCPVPEAHYDLMAVGKPKTIEDIAEDWLHLLLAHRNETPMESFGRVKELMMKWHHICTPLDQHLAPEFRG